MAATSLRRLVLILAILLVWTWEALPASTCPFCETERGPTLVGDFGQASMVLLGTFTKPQIAKGGLEEGTTEFEIEKVLKAHDLVAGKKNITIPRYINQPKTKFLIFCDVYKTQIDPFKGVEVSSDSQLVKYLEGAVKFKDRPAPERLRYCFDFLNNPEIEVALDAYREYAKADYKDYMDIAKKLPADTIAGWLKDQKTPAFRYGLYSSLLGHCGTNEHAKLLRQMIDDPEKRRGSGVDGMLAAYVMLQPKEGWNHLQSILKDGSQEFLMRYAVLRTVRFFWDQRPDLVDKKDLVQGVAQILAHADMADFAIEDLRKWQRWEMAGPILELFTRKTHDIPVVKRAILRYALRCPDPRAVAFVREQRIRDPQWVQDTEALLEIDAPATPAPKK